MGIITKLNRADSTARLALSIEEEPGERFIVNRPSPLSSPPRLCTVWLSRLSSRATSSTRTN